MAYRKQGEGNYKRNSCLQVSVSSVAVLHVCETSVCNLIKARKSPTPKPVLNSHIQPLISPPIGGSCVDSLLAMTYPGILGRR